MPVKMHGMNPASQQISADGCWYIAVNHPSGGRFQVFREYPDGRTEELPETKNRLIGGQGKLELQGDGTLWASFGATAGASLTDRFQIRQYVPFPRGGFEGFDLTGLWMGILTPANENDGQMHARWNNFRDNFLRRYAKK